MGSFIMVILVQAYVQLWTSLVRDDEDLSNLSVWSSEILSNLVYTPKSEGRL